MANQLCAQHERQVTAQNNDEKNFYTTPVMEAVRWNEQKSGQNYPGESKGSHPRSLGRIEIDMFGRAPSRDSSEFRNN